MEQRGADHGEPGAQLPLGSCPRLWRGAAVTPLPETSQALRASLEEAGRRLALPVIPELDLPRGGATAEGRPGGRPGSPSRPGIQR